MNFWTIGAIVLAALVTYAMARFGYGKKIGEWAGIVDSIAEEVDDLRHAVVDSFKPDKDGVVRLTAEEVAWIYECVDELLEEVGLDLPDWPGTEEPEDKDEEE